MKDIFILEIKIIIIKQYHIYKDKQKIFIITFCNYKRIYKRKVHKNIERG